MVQFQDYYKILGVERTATQAEIRKAYRKLARKYHPDVNKDKGAEAKFKTFTEAYEILDNPEKRKQYDQFGNGYTHGQEFRPPPGYSAQGFGSSQAYGAGAGRGQYSGASGGAGFDQFEGFGDLFESLFGAGAGMSGAAGQGRSRSGQGRSAQGRRQQAPPPAPEPLRAELTISASEFIAGGSKRISIAGRSVDVRIPVGIKPGASIRLAGLGGENQYGMPVDIIVKITVSDDATYRFEDEKLITTLEISPSIAALGGGVQCATPQGAVKLNIPASIRSGQKMRLAGKGRLISTKEVGELFVEIKIQVPKVLSEAERELYGKLLEIERGKSPAA